MIKDLLCCEGANIRSLEMECLVSKGIERELERPWNHAVHRPYAMGMMPRDASLCGNVVISQRRLKAFSRAEVKGSRGC